MKIEFVNHASVLIEYDGITLLTDPWYKGIVVNNGWALLTPSKFSVDDFEKVTHIWFSHEHSDHFVPNLLKEIPLETRKRITVLYHFTDDKKVIEFCKKKLEFGQVIELAPGIPISLSKNIKFQCTPYHSGDSWFYLQTPEISILNINDCMVKTSNDASAIQGEIGSIDLLLTQFGYAHKIGNEEDISIRQEAALEKMERLFHQINVFKPKYLLPFASFSIFCHEENFYMNNEQVKVNDVKDFICSNFPDVKPIVMFPGDHWDIREPYNSFNSIEKYKLAYQDISNYPIIKTKPVSKEILKQNATLYGQKLITKNPTALQLINKIGTLFYITDQNVSFEFKGSKGFIEIDTPREDCDVAISSDSLNYILLHEWGGMTCVGNARYFTTKRGDIYKFDLLVRIADLNNQGKEYVWIKPTLVIRILHRIKSIIKKYFKKQFP